MTGIVLTRTNREKAPWLEAFFVSPHALTTPELAPKEGCPVRVRYAQDERTVRRCEIRVEPREFTPLQLLQGRFCLYFTEE